MKMMNEHLVAVEQKIAQMIQDETNEKSLAQSMQYSVDAGGKRIRPLLLLSTVLLFQPTIPKAAIDAAAALEMVHTYSLIHDDLPAMDDDDLRRGKPTNHKVFGEDMAILAGDALLTLAFQVLASIEFDAKDTVRLVTLLATSSGPSGMVAGQVADMRGEKRQIDQVELQAIHERKTGELIRFALLAGGIISQVSEQELIQLDQLARKIGLAFQIRDDILDVIATTDELGKTAHRDEALDKSTYPKLLGLAGAKAALTRQLEEAQEILTTLAQENRTTAPMQAILAQLALQKEA
ncbi:polyprenyl synthetase family protein [uncultured Enterococcus sp.]|uniref:polyprenyl synthetase family protein n=1 Tax=uncultured Enterococcus sp. TaxID=167972 RepID=UPI0025FD7D1C|nr:farnesyl diphosphate synthase [uncultured Enterococcus sp.]